MYDGLRDMINHLETLKAHIMLYNYDKEKAYRAFPLTLKGTVMNMFETLKLEIIDNFKDLAKFFFTQFMAIHRKI